MAPAVARPHHPPMAWNTPFESFDAGTSTTYNREEPIELVGTHLRLTGIIALNRFGRLSDLINGSSGAVRVHDARLLLPNGDPTDLILPELMVDQDEISFIAQRVKQPRDASIHTGFGGHGGGGATFRTPRMFVMFMPGHTVWGHVYVFGETDLSAFMDATDPRFVAVTEVRTQSLARRGIINEFPFVLINRTQMIAASEIDERSVVPEHGFVPKSVAGA
jgi:hypothetical protein